MRLGRALATIGGWTVVSRLTGLAREILVARYLGAGVVSDAFFVAFRFPNLFRSLFAEGAFNAAFVPLFAGKLENEGREAARRFAEQCMAVLGTVVFAVVVAFEIFMPAAMLGLAPGFDDVPGKMALAIELSRITFPYLLFIALVSLQSGVLNALGRFAAAAGTPVLLNLTSITLLLALMPYTPTAGHAMAWGVFASGIVQCLWLVRSVRRAGMPLHLVFPRLSPDVRRLLGRVVPGAVGAGVYQLNLVINTMIASEVANGAVSYLNYADRISQLPLGVVGIAMGTALLPLLSRQLRAGDPQAALDSQNRGLELCLLLTIPAAFALVVLAQPVVAVLFERGSFGVADTRAVAPALAAFALGLPALVMVKVLTPGFFAREDTRTPVRIAVAAMLLNIVLNLALIHPLRHVGMALATSIAGWANVLALAWVLKRRGYFIVDGRLARRAVRILLSGLIMTGALMAVRHLLSGLLAVAGLQRDLVLAAVMGGGLIVYAGATVVTGATRPAELTGWLVRRSS